MLDHQGHLALRTPQSHTQLHALWAALVTAMIAEVRRHNRCRHTDETVVITALGREISIRTASGRALDIKLNPRLEMITESISVPGRVCAGAAAHSALRFSGGGVRFAGGTPDEVARTMLRRITEDSPDQSL
jgi:hypothetical protein